MQEFLGELQIRLLKIKSEPNGLVRETMISNLLIDSDMYLEMEKEQIIDAFDNGLAFGFDDAWHGVESIDSTQYYKETYEL